jgi:hypothetical protein
VPQQQPPLYQPPLLPYHLPLLLLGHLHLQVLNCVFASQLFAVLKKSRTLPRSYDQSTLLRLISLTTSQS